MLRKICMLVVAGMLSTSLYGITATVKTNTNSGKQNQNSRYIVQAANAPSSATEPQAVIAAFVKSWNAHDPKAMAAFWAEEGDLIDPWGKLFSGRRAVEKTFTSEQATIFKDSTLAMSIDAVKFLGNDIALVDVTAKLTGATDEQGQPKGPMNHHVIWVMQRQTGVWKVISARPYVFLSR